MFTLIHVSGKFVGEPIFLIRREKVSISMYCCGIRKCKEIGPQDLNNSEETLQSLISEKLFRSLSGISLPHTNTYEGYTMSDTGLFPSIRPEFFF